MDHKSSSSKKGKKSKSKDLTKKEIPRLNESDHDYPKDIPSGSKEYELFWRKELREVMDQGVRRVCWTVASTRSLSARLLIEKKVNSLKYFSALHLLIALYDKTSSSGELKDLRHLKKFLEENGAILEKDCKCIDPLAEMKKRNPSKAKVMNDVCTSKQQPKCVFKVKELVVMDDVDEKHLISLVNKGPVAITIVYHVDFAKFTGEGIYEGPEVKRQFRADYGYHMLLCTGYGTLNGVHYWEVQNSAGIKWGNNGFGKIIRQVSRGKDKQSLIQSVIYPILHDHYEDED